MPCLLLQTGPRFKYANFKMIFIWFLANLTKKDKKGFLIGRKIIFLKKNSRNKNRQWWDNKKQK